MDLLETAKPFLFENMPTVKSIEIMLKTDERAAKIENAQMIKEGAVPGKPTAVFY